VRYWRSAGIALLVGIVAAFALPASVPLWVFGVGGALCTWLCILVESWLRS